MGELIRINIQKRRETIEGNKGGEQGEKYFFLFFFFFFSRRTCNTPFSKASTPTSHATFDTDKLKLLARLAAHYWLVSKISRLRVGPPTFRLVLTTFSPLFFFFHFQEALRLRLSVFFNHCTTVGNEEKRKREREKGISGSGNYDSLRARFGTRSMVCNLR